MKHWNEGSPTLSIRNAPGAQLDSPRSEHPFALFFSFSPQENLRRRNEKKKKKRKKKKKVHKNR